MKKRSIAAIISVLLSLGVFACSRDAHKLKITQQNKDSFMQSIRDSKSLTVDEVRMLIAYRMRNAASQALGGKDDTMVGKTVGQIIDEERQFEARAKQEENRQEHLAAEAKAQEEARAAELRKAIGLTVYDKSFKASDPDNGQYEDKLVIKCAYENTSGKDIRAFKGKIRFTDLFGSQIYESSLTVSDPIKAGKKATWTGYINYNQFLNQEVQLRNTQLKDMRVVWLPSSIIFADGTVLGDPPAH
jgi:hypothetical protein